MESEAVKITSLDTLEEYLSNRNTSINAFYLSDIPEICKELPCILGIDEAGRGPVLGPMVYGIAFCPIEKEAHLKVLECDDSKSLTEQKRDVIFSNICKSGVTMGWAIEVISPNIICNSMLRRTKHSLNAVSMDSAVMLTKAVINAGVNVSHLYVDTVGKPEKYQAYLNSLFPAISITVAKKADATYPIVSAASICAKVTRDHALNVWKFPEQLELSVKDLGSGYPGDPVTKKFLSSRYDPIFGYPQVVRFSWSTASNALKDHAYEVEWEDPEDENVDSGSTSTPTLMSFFTHIQKPSIKKRKRHEFFRLRNLDRTTEF